MSTTYVCLNEDGGWSWTPGVRCPHCKERIEVREGAVTADVHALAELRQAFAEIVRLRAEVRRLRSV